MRSEPFDKGDANRVGGELKPIGDDDRPLDSAHVGAMH